MRISTRLILAALVPGLMALVAIVGVVRSYYPIADLQRRQATGIQIRSDLGELNDLARSYLVNHDERSRRQFLAKSDELDSEVAAAAMDDGRYEQDVETIAQDVRLTRSLFSRIVANYERRSAADDPMFREAEDLLSTQLFIRSGDAFGVAGHLVQSISDDIVTTEQRTSLLITVFTVLAAILLTAGLIALRSNITRSLLVLRAGTEAIGGGNLDYRIGLSGPDELGELGRSFDLMSERLKGVTVSKDDLEREVERRRRAEERAQRELERTKLLQEVTTTANSSLSLPEIGRRVLALTSERLGLSAGSVWIVDRAANQLRALARVGYSKDASRIQVVPIDEESVNAQLVLHDLPVITHEDRLPRLTEDRERVMGLETMRWLGMPIKRGESTLGVLGFVFEGRRPFEEDELSLYRSIAELLGSAFENARLYEAERNIADRLQEALLTLPDHIGGVAFAHAYHGATEAARVGGDFYDIFELNHHHVGITIGDVAGKGLDAAVLTSLVKNTIRAHANEKGKTPTQILTLTNDVVYKSTTTEAFVTVFFAILDCRDGRLVYANAGHTTAALVREDGTVSKLPVTGPLLGAFSDVTFEQSDACLGLDELLFLYTDGLTEARREGELYGEERVFAVLSTIEDGAVQDVVGAVIADVLSFSGNRLRDDLAIISVRRLEQGAETPTQQKLEV